MKSDIKFLNIEYRAPYSLTNFEDRFRFRVSVIFLLQYVWFPVYLYYLPNSSGQLTELIVHITPWELICTATRFHWCRIPVTIHY